jgi:histidinol-phosphate aminotransferase
MIAPSKRLHRVERVFDPYRDRSGYVRLDRNEDPSGWDAEMFDVWKASLTPYDLAAYADSTRLARKLAAWLRVDPARLLITAGSDAAIKTIFETYVDPGERVLVQDPSWAMYGVYNDVYQGELVKIAYGPRLEFDSARVIDALRIRPIRMALFANPNQPTGTVMPEGEVRAIVEAARERGTVAVMDEAYHMFSPVTAVPLVESCENLIVVRTFSKAFGLAGLRLGYCVADPARIRELMLLRPVTDSNSIALKAAEFALDHIDWVERRAADMVKGRNLLISGLRSRGASVFDSHCNFVLVPCRGEDDARAAVAAVRDKGYLIKGPYGFEPLRNFVRVSIGPSALMGRFVEECGAAIARHAKPQS